MEKQLSFGEWLRKRNTTPRLAGWRMYVLSKVTTETEIKALRKWCRDSLFEGFKVQPERVASPIYGKKMCIATTVWIQSDDDAVLFKLRWSGHE